MRPRLLALVLCLLAFGGGGAARAADDAPDLLRVAVRADGFYRVAPKALAVLPPGPVRGVTRGGSPTPWEGSREDGLVFLAHDVAKPTSGWAVYEIRTGAEEGPPAADAPAAPAAAPALRPLPSARWMDRDVVFGDLAGGRAEVYAPAQAPTWFLASILPGRALELDLDPAGAAPGRDQTLRVDLWSTHVGAVALAASWGGHDLGIAEGPTAAGGATFEWRVPAAQVPAGPAALVVRDVSPPLPPPPPQDVSHGRGTLWVDRIGLVGPVAARIEGELAAFEVPPGVALALALAPDAPGPAHLALVDPTGAPLPRPAYRREGDLLVVAPHAGPPGTRLFAQRGASAVEPRPAHAARPPLETAGTAPHLIVAVPDLLEPARRLAAHRTAHGIRSAVVSLADVYAHYAGGEHDPAALVRFLRERMAAAPPLRFVVLAGDATLDRTDMRREMVLPALMARTLYNGATAADRLYVMPEDRVTGGPSIGRLPFDDAASMNAWVDRLVRYETSPPVDPSRRLMRFITSEGRFGPFIDGLLENKFQAVVTNDVPPAYDIEVTFAAPRSPRLWPPPELNAKVIDGFNQGCLFYTYVGHGFAEGFDTLRVDGQRYRILHADDVDRIACARTPPATFVFACTTALFDAPGVEGIGERLLANPAGPIAYWGATRICHPAANAMYGSTLARAMAEDEGGRRLGEILDVARDRMLDAGPDSGLQFLQFVTNLLARGADASRLNLEASWMYVLLGDPATRVAFPRGDVAVEATADGPELRVVLRAPLPDGTVLHASLEAPRNQPIHAPEPVTDPTDPAAFATIRQNHDRVNDLAYARRDVEVHGGRAELVFDLPAPDDDARPARLVVKAWALTPDDVHQGAVVVDLP